MTAAVPPTEPEKAETAAVADPPPEATPSSVAAPETKPDPSAAPPFTHTRASGYWAAVVVGLLVLLVDIIFILENGQRAKVSFFGAHWQLPEGVALLLAAVIGGLFVVLAGAARILQLRSRARTARRPPAGAAGAGTGRRGRGTRRHKAKRGETTPETVGAERP